MDAKSTFVKRFGDLVTLLRLDPGNDGAQELALEAAAAAVADQSIEVEAGVEWSTVPPEMGLKARMLARQVDCLRITAGAQSRELEALARALAHDVTPVRSSPSIEVAFVRLLAPPPRPEDGGSPRGGPAGGAPVGGPSGGRAAENRRRSPERRRADERRRSTRAPWIEVERRRGPGRRVSGERRLVLLNDLRAESTRLLQVLVHAARSRAWQDVLHTAWALLWLAPRIPLAGRRMFILQVRRALPRPVLEALVDVAERDYVAREAAAQVLWGAGLDGVQVVLDRLRRGEALGVRVFFYEDVSGQPSAYPTVVPLLRGSRSHEIRHGAALLGRLGLPDAVGELGPPGDHPDELVRAAVPQALGELLALLIAAALQTETDRGTWQAMVGTLGRIGSAEACAALIAIAVTRRSILRRHGYTTGPRHAGAAGTSERGRGELCRRSGAARHGLRAG